MTLVATKLRYCLKNRKVVKVITGLSNFDVDSIVKTVKAAEIAGATYVDVASSPKLVKILKSITNLPICVSSIEPKDLYKCLLAGADIFEVGNFDHFYSKNIYISGPQIINLVREVKSFLNDKPLCVTIPHTLLLDEQVDLVRKIAKSGVTMVQTEGYISKNKTILDSDSLIVQSTHLSSCALSTSYILSRQTSLPVIASSGLSYISAPIAIACGASGIGIGSALLNYKSVSRQAEYINQLTSSLDMSDTNMHFSCMYTSKVSDMFSIYN